MICLDSDCIIDFLKGKENAIQIIKENKDSLVTTEINVFEVWFGIYLKKELDEKEAENTRIIFDSLEILPFDNNSGEIATKILSKLTKKGNIVNQNDCFIAAIMIKNNCNMIITNNKKDFSRIEEIKVKSY